MKNKVSAAVSLVLLVAAFFIIRFPLYSWHDMKEMPLYLMLAGLMVIMLSFASGKKLTPVMTAVGYAAGFFISYFFSVTSIDSHGASTNNMFVIWAIAFIACVFIGLIADIMKKQRKP